MTLSNNLYNSLNKMAKFRNVIVHHYDKVDASIVVSILNKYLQDFLAYKEAIVGIIKDVVESEKQSARKDSQD